MAMIPVTPKPLRCRGWRFICYFINRTWGAKLQLDRAAEATQRPLGAEAASEPGSPPFVARLGLVPEAVAQAWDRIRPTSHAASAQPAPVKKPTQNQTPIR